MSDHRIEIMEAEATRWAISRAKAMGILPVGSIIKLRIEIEPPGIDTPKFLSMAPIVFFSRARLLAVGTREDTVLNIHSALKRLPHKSLGDFLSQVDLSDFASADVFGRLGLRAVTNCLKSVGIYT